MNQVLCLPLLLLGLPLPSHPLPQFLLRPNSIFPPAVSFSSHFPPLVYPSSTSHLLYQAPGSQSKPGLLYQAGPISASPRARCSSCDCSADFGCSYNCDKCPALCKTCSCVTSLGCHYNCDKCLGNNSEPALVDPPVIISLVDEDLIEDEEGEGSSSTSPLAPVGGVPSLGGEDGAGLLFPLPGGGHLEEAEDLENSVDSDDYSEETTGDVGPSDPNVIQAGSSCHVLVSDFELCKWGPSCATILREQFPDCDYDCATCTLKGSSQDSSIIEVEAVEEAAADGGPPPIAAVVAEGEEDEGPWTWATDGPACVAIGGEGAGSDCRFPFTYEGVVYKGCAYKPGGSTAPVPPGSLGWCSTKRDINGIHINGPAGNPWKYVGFCDNSCPSA